jgi:hypothetical protein
VDGGGGIYLDQIDRPLEVIRFPAPAAGRSDPPAVERIAAPALWHETGAIGRPLQLPDGRVLLPTKAGGRDRLLVAAPGKDPVPLLDDGREETAMPASVVGPRRVAFVAGSGKDRRLRLAALEEDGVRLEPVELAVTGEGLTALAASPDGKALYYVQSRQVFEVPTDGSRPPATLGPGDGVTVYPASGALLVQRFEGAGVRLFRLPRPAGQPEEIRVKPGSSRLVTLPMGGGMIHRDGRVLVASTSNDSWFWRTAILTADGDLQPVPAAFDGDVHPAGWATDDRILGTGYSLRSELWRFRPAPPAARGPFTLRP